MFLKKLDHESWFYHRKHKDRTFDTETLLLWLYLNGWRDDPDKVKKQKFLINILLFPILFFVRHWKFWLMFTVGAIGAYISWSRSW